MKNTAMAASTEQKSWPVHLVLAGGGVKSLAFAGTLEVLAASNIEFASVSTCSAGTFVGALLCCGLTPATIVEELMNLRSWAALAGTRASPIPDFVYGLVPGLLTLHPMLRWPFALYRKSGFADAFRTILRDDPTFGDLANPKKLRENLEKKKPPLAIAAFDVAAQRYLVYASDTHPKMRVSEALSMAVSIPFAYPPKLTDDGRMIMDAGVASECPVWLAADRCYDYPIVALRPKKNILSRRPEAMSLDQFYMETTGSVVRGLDDYIILKMPRVRLIEIDCGNIRGDHFAMTDTEKRQLIEAGRDAAREALTRHGKGLRLPSQEKTRQASSHRRDDDDAAMKHATELMRRFHQNMSRDSPTQVFISYAHQDLDVAKTIYTKLGDFLTIPNPLNAIWYDKRIEAGDTWKKMIINKMMESKVALLLVSPSFLSSDFIRRVELPKLKDLCDAKRITLIPFIIEDCQWEEAVGFIKEKQFFSNEPFEGLKNDEERNKVLGNLADKIQRELLA